MFAPTSADNSLNQLMRHNFFIRTSLKAAFLVLWVIFLRWLAYLSDFGDNVTTGFMANMGSPHGWRFFICAYVPLGFFLLSACGEFVCSFGQPADQSSFAESFSKAVRKFHKIDILSMASLPLIALLIVFHRNFSQWALITGAIFLSTLLFKAFFIGNLLWQKAAKTNCSENFFLKDWQLVAWGSAFLAASICLSLVFWTNQAVSTTGDEPAYLINAQRAIQALSDQKEQTSSPDKHRFYWGRWSQKLAQPLARSPLFISILAFPVKTSGRIGALFVASLALGLCLAVFILLAKDLNFSPRTSLKGAFLLFISSPFFQLSQHVYPGIFGILFTLVGLRILVKNPSYNKKALWGLIGVIAALTLIKLRFAPVALGLIATSAFQWLPWTNGQAKKLGWFVLASFGVLLGLILLAPHILPETALKYLAKHSFIYCLDYKRMGFAAIAMFFDQEFGLMAYAPCLALGLIGLLAFYRHNARAFALSLFLGICNLLSILIWRWNQWDGGFTAPGRFLAPLMPLLALWALPLLRKKKNYIWNTVLYFLLGISFLVTFILSLVPQWRYHRRTGINNLILQLNELTDSFCHHFFPSFVNYHTSEMLPTIFFVLAFTGLGVFFYKVVQKETAPSRIKISPGFTALSLGAIVLLVLIFSGKTIPTSHIQAEAMQRKGAILFGSKFSQPVLLILGKKGAKASNKVMWGKDTDEIIIKARYVPVGKRQKGPKARPVPVLEIFLDDQSIGKIRIDRRKTKFYTVQAKAEPGLRKLTVSCLSQSGRDQIAIDRIMLKP